MPLRESGEKPFKGVLVSSRARNRVWSDKEARRARSVLGEGRATFGNTTVLIQYMYNVVAWVYVTNCVGEMERSGEGVEGFQGTGWT